MAELGGCLVHSLVTLFSKIPQFLFTWSFFFGAGMISFLWHHLAARRPLSLKALLRDCIPFDPLRSKSFHIDVITYVFTKLTLFVWTIPGFAVYAALSAGLAYLLERAGGPLPDASAGPIATLLCTLAIFIFAEFAYFVVHYSNHKVPALWELHKVHHSAVVLNPLTNTRAHPVSQAYKFLVIGIFSALPSGLAIHFYGFSLAELVVLTAVADKLASVFTLDALRHSHFPISFGPLDRVFISPHMHHIHHSTEPQHHDTNFGLNLSVFDWIFGTAYKPAPGERPESGIYGYTPAQMAEHQTVRGAYITPLVRIAQGFARPLKGRPQGLPEV